MIDKLLNKIEFITFDGYKFGISITPRGNYFMKDNISIDLDIFWIEFDDEIIYQIPKECFKPIQERHINND